MSKLVQNDSENSESRNVRKPDDQKIRNSGILILRSSDNPSPSEFSEKRSDILKPYNQYRCHNSDDAGDYQQANVYDH